MRLTRKIGLQETNLVSKHPTCSSPNLLVEETCDFPLRATLFKIKISSGKIIAVNVSQTSIMICILNARRMSWLFSKRQE